VEIFQQLNNYSGLLTILGIIVAIIIGVATILPIITRKKLTWQIISVSQIVNVKEDNGIERKLKVVFEDAVIRNPFLIEIKLKNMGNKAITEENFRTDININFLNKIEILEAECIYQESKDYKINPIINNDEGKMCIPRFLLNPKKSIKLKMVANIIDNIKDGDIELEACIEDVMLKRINSIQESKKKDFIMFKIINVIPIIAFIFMMLLGIVYSYFRDSILVSIMVFIVIITFMIMPITSIWALDFIKEKFNS